MMKRILALALASVCLMAVPPMGSNPAGAVADRVLAVDCRSGNDQCWPTAFAFTPSGDHVFYVERFTGQIRRAELGTGNDVRWATVNNVATDGEQGVLGIALDPRWAQAFRFRWVYVYYTHDDPLQNRIIRMRKLAGGGMKRHLLQRIPAFGNHNAGVIHIGPDDKLWAVTGDAGQPSRSQDRNNPAGKILRLNLTGTRPDDNPIPGSKAYSFGHRNSFGFTFDPVTDRPWQTENGPGCEDEINHIRRGRNYGWGADSDCPGTNTSGPNPVQPAVRYTPTIAPTGAAFCDGCGLAPAVEGDLLFGSWNDDKIRRLVLNTNRNDVVGQFVLFTNPTGVLAVEAAPNGRIYFSDPNGIYRLVEN